MEGILSYLKKAYDPLAMILYGSYADGSDNLNSDYDALLVTEVGVFYHDTSVVEDVQLDVFVYPVSDLGENCDLAEFVQIFDGKIILDTDGIGQSFKDRVVELIMNQPAISHQKIMEDLQWCRKMLLRIRRDDAEGLYRWHWLLVDSLEIACEILHYPYCGPKKSLAWMKKEYPDLFDRYHNALQKQDMEALGSWIQCLENHAGECK